MNHNRPQNALLQWELNIDKDRIVFHHLWPLRGAVILLLLSSLQARGQFTQIYPALPTDRPLDVVFRNQSVVFFPNAAGSIFRTTNGGTSWERRTHYQGDPIDLIRFVDPSLGFAASSYSSMWLNKVSSLVTTDGGQWWYPVDVNLSDAEDFLPVSRSLLLKGTEWGIQRLDNFFGQWVTTYPMPFYIDIDVGAPFGTVHQFINPGNGEILALISYWKAKRAHIISDSVSRVVRSRDGGLSWDTLWQGSKLSFRSFAFATASVGWMGGENETILRTTDGGTTWLLQHTDSLSQSNIQTIVALDTLRAFAAGGSGEFFRTTDGGTTWTREVIETTWETKTKLAFSDADTGFFAGTELYKTTDGGTHWHPVNNRIHSVTTHIQFVNARLGWVLGDSALFATTDGGYSWSSRNNFAGNPQILHFDMIDSLTGWAVGQHQWMKTTDGGSTWTSWNFESSVEYVRGVQFFNKDLGVIYEVREFGWNDASVFVTTDGGINWTKRQITNLEFLSSWFKMKFTDPGHLWFANQQGLWLSRDTARTWVVYDSLEAFNSAFDFADSMLGICDRSAYEFGRTFDGGRSWSFLAKPYPNQTLDMAIIDPYNRRFPSALLVGYDGTILENQEGFGVRAVISYTLSPLQRLSVYREGNIAHVWVLGSSFEVLHATYLITGVEANQSASPASFALEQNYPNPFNGTTGIRYQVPVPSGVEGSGTSDVKLIVYDVLGREVATLVNEVKQPGEYTVHWDASRMASGVYFYRLEAGGLVQTKKMVILK